MSAANNLLILSAILIFMTFPLPFFGKMANKYNYKRMIIYSTIGMILLLYPLYYGIRTNNLTATIFTTILFFLFYSCMTSLIPYISCDLFPTSCRFTCVATSFNLADAIVGGFTPVLGLYILRYSGDTGSFCWILLIFALLSLGSFLLIKERNANAQ